MTEGPRPTDIEAPEIEPQDRFIAPDQPEDPALRLEQTEPDPALDEQEDEPGRGDRERRVREQIDREREDREQDEVSEQSFPASDPPAY